MAKVNIGLRGWRFDESEVFDESGDFRPLSEMDDEVARRLVRLQAVIDRPCDACYLTHGDGAIEQCAPAEVVYGEPLAEVLLCADHEADFYYWYEEAGGKQYRGTEAFRDEFHEWFAAGNRAPEDYEGLDHVDTDPEAVPDPTEIDPDELSVDLAEEERVDVDLRGLDLDDPDP